MDTEYHHDLTSDSTMSDKTIATDPPVQAQEPWASVPRRKPLPLTKGPETFSGSAAVDDGLATGNEAETGAENKHGTLSADAHISSKRVWPFSLSGSRLRIQRRSRKFLVIGIVAAVLLLALIIGLAVGLTVGKKKASNLPLPTSNGGPYSGDLTYYDPGLGSCGYTSTESESVCAVSHILFDAASTGSNPNDNPLCGLKIRLRRNGKSVDVKVVDRCVGCKVDDLDVTESVFEKVAEIAQGRVTMEWAWLDKLPDSVS
ncbi:uncharacterized protein N7477_002839 [Penicillium maclennaniae]|uniref:uncharacterized protein n=1 Tax=Penicillium maclennaniae TaxID=1343394 RepID=UPI002541065A|nr:uncharacterized protein N7477_002839 [Penicillium maclennaniae]KAJ5677206.1 hypothetical protein N7477_002839 [Penicillium maclennaniae]